MIKVAVFNDTRPHGHYGCMLVMRHLIDQLRQHGMEPVWFWPVGRDWRVHAADVPRAPQIDAVIVNGEGTMHHSATTPEARALADIGRFAGEHLGVPAFLINTTVDELEDRVCGQLSYFRRVFVRESRSLALLTSRGISASVVPDLAFGFDPPRTSTSPSSVAGTDSVFPDVSRAIQQVCAGHGWRFRAMLNRRLLREAPTRDPRLFLRRIARRSLTHITGQARPEAFAAFLTRHALVVTGRFHGVAMCLITETPFLALESNTPKTSALLHDVFGHAQRVINVAELQALSADAARPWTDLERAQIAAYRQRAAAEIPAMFAAIRSQID